MTEPVEFQEVEIDPVGCYKQALELIKEDYWLLMGVSVVGMLLGGTVPIVLVGPMTCGVYLCFLAKYRGEKFEFDLLFKGFDYFVPSLIASLIMFGIVMLVFMPICLVMFAILMVSMISAQPDGGQAGPPAIALLGTLSVPFLGLFFLLLIIAVSMFFVFAFPLIVDRKLTGTAAVATSARAVAKNLGGVLGLTLINTVLGIAGLMACYVGSFFVLPITFAAITIAYRKVFPEIVAEPLSLPEGGATPPPLGPEESPA